MSAIPVYREQYLTRSKHRPRGRTKSGVGAAVMARATWFFIILGVTFLASSLSGNVMMEKARREGLRAQDRAQAAKKAEAGLRQSIDAMTGMTAVGDWALAHGFRAPEQLVQPPKGDGLVAINR
jgi:hypothetical protein